MAEYRWVKVTEPFDRWLYTGEDKTLRDNMQKGEYLEFDGPFAEVVQCRDLHTNELLDSWVMTIFECNHSDDYYGEEPEYFDSEDEAKRMGEVKVGLTRDKGTGETLKWEKK